MEKNQTIFISHITQENRIACILKELIEEKFLDTVSVFVSSHEDGLKMGTDWMSTIKKSMEDCQILIVVCSPLSIKRPWINFEAGAGWIKGIPVIPMCHSGLTPSELPVPLNSFQGGNLGNIEDIKRVFSRIAEVFGMKAPKLNSQEIDASIKTVEYEIEHSIIVKNTRIAHGLLFENIQMMKYALLSSSLDYEEFVEPRNEVIDKFSSHKIVFNKIHNLYNVPLLMFTLTKKNYQFAMQTYENIVNNVKVILSFNNLELSDDLIEVLTQIFLMPFKPTIWHEGLHMIENNGFKDSVTQTIKDSSDVPTDVASNIICYPVFYYNFSVYMQHWIIDIENIIESVLNAKRED